MTTAVTGSTATTSSTTSTAVTAASGLESLSDNYNTFMSLLTAQLKNQDPLSPVDSTQFTSQLVQMNGVQQQLLSNQLLQKLVDAGSSGLSGGVDYIGKTVTADSSSAALSGGKAAWNYTLGSGATDATLTVKDSSGNTVWSGDASDLTAGSHAFSWDGKSSSGATEPDGTYTLSVAATDSSGAAVDTSVAIQGTATAAQMVNGAAYLTIGAALVPLSSVTGVALADAA